MKTYQWKYTPEELAKAVSISTNFCEVCRNLKVKTTGGSYYNVRRRIARLNLDISHFNKDSKTLCRNIIIRKKPLEDIFILLEEKDGRTEAKLLRRALLESGVPYKCVECGNEGEWNNKKLILAVDHIDGNWKNNFKENLRFLCPNCHSQTDTFGNKRRIKKIDKRFLDKPHLRKVKERPTLEVLLQQVEEFGFVGTGKIYSVSDNAIRKWLKRMAV